MSRFYVNKKKGSDIKLLFKIIAGTTASTAIENYKTSIEWHSWHLNEVVHEIELLLELRCSKCYSARERFLYNCKICVLLC